jgi:mannose-6-phosphate isomerase-like protein (cupin superfamily)
MASREVQTFEEYHGDAMLPAHAHDGIEAFLVLEGSGIVETDGASRSIGLEECLVLDATREHGLFNPGPGRLRYLVITAP